MPTEIRPGPRHADPAPQCEGCSVRTICNGCRHGDGCDWCFCDGLECGSCGTKCRSHAERPLWEANVGTLELDLCIERQPEIALPPFIPSVKLRARMRENLPPWTYTVAINDIIKADGTPRPSAWRIREFFPEGSQLILNFFSEDHLLEPIWSMGTEFWSGEGSGWLANFDAIMGVNYSLYADDSSFEIMHCLKRMQMSNQEIHDAGHKVIPLLAYVEEKQLADQLENYCASGLHTVVINMQVLEGEKATYQRQNAAFLKHIALYTNWRVIAHGIARRDIAEELARAFGPGRFVLSNSSAFFDTMRKPSPNRRAMMTGQMRKYLSYATAFENPGGSLEEEPPAGEPPEGGD